MIPGMRQGAHADAPRRHKYPPRQVSWRPGDEKRPDGRKAETDDDVAPRECGCIGLGIGSPHKAQAGGTRCARHAESSEPDGYAHQGPGSCPAVRVHPTMLPENGRLRQSPLSRASPGSNSGPARLFARDVGQGRS